VSRYDFYRSPLALPALLFEFENATAYVVNEEVLVMAVCCYHCSADVTALSPAGGTAPLMASTYCVVAVQSTVMTGDKLVICSDPRKVSLTCLY
jgi:hypothetical protein